MKIYTFIIIKTDINDFLNYLITNKYTNKKTDIKTKLVYNSLNKIVTINNKIIEKEPIKEIINVSTIPKETKPMIYIYNTHDTEEYFSPTNDYSITPTVKIASYILKDHLNNKNIDSTVEINKIKTYLNKHNLNYYGSYDASRYYLQQKLKENDYKILIDIHRDSVKKNISLLEANNKRYARVLFVLTKKHKNYKENEKFVKNLNSRINKKIKNLSRGIMNRTDVIFNQDLSPYAILLEVGGVDNTIEEVNNTLEIISEVLSEYINEELNG